MPARTNMLLVFLAGAALVLFGLVGVREQLFSPEVEEPAVVAGLFPGEQAAPEPVPAPGAGEPTVAVRLPPSEQVAPERIAAPRVEEPVAVSGPAPAAQAAPGTVAAPGVEEPGIVIALAPAEQAVPETVPAPEEADTARPAIPTRTVVLTVDGGDTLSGLLRRAGLDRGESQAVISAVGPVYDLQRMRIGQSFTIEMLDESRVGQGAHDDGDAAQVPGLVSMSFRPTVEQEIMVLRTGDGGYSTEVIDLHLEVRDAYVESEITTSLYLAAKAKDVPMNVLAQVIRMFSYAVDFQRGIHPGDSFSVLFETHHDGSGAMVRGGSVIWAALSLSGTTLEFVRHVPADGRTDYFDRGGRSNRTALMRTPIDGARLSSSYGKRKHPILGYTRMHRGLDFAAPKGVPIMAAGDGTIESIGRNGDYGKYIRIRHDSEYKTAYAHMSRYAKGLNRHSRVRQGQVIGYVGSTGLSTGPHLHYEVIRNGRQINPQTMKLPGKKLKGADLKTLARQWDLNDDRVAAARADRTYVKGTDRHG